ncbi:ABC transporter substrate-binding protein [Arsenicitalea aurantiaca]|uniref:ABC transporter substrate-binding protein n=1 Tax=Arsenicitalea aurantiaca TaxID=1783274 RepID=A0A433XBF9_9HYPH|nr:TRAP transporter substrate-binding protein [Arsenicitalea aurantiaca]RUT31419.1 ABC transporter substrate-binding protein [Arsenicitalea aurantiaca]
MSFSKVLLAGAALAFGAQAATAQQISWLSQSQNQSAQYPVEIAAIEEINAEGFTVLRNEFQALGISMADGLRLVREGTFNLASIQVGLVASDDPFLEGIDLIGVSTDTDSLADAVAAYREAFDARLEERFGVKAMAVWPFGGQIFFCNEPIETLADLQGLKVRSFTASMSSLLERLGATPVTLAFPEVYPALQRGVASCGITSATSANTGKWPEVTSHVLPLSVSGSIQAHVVNLEWFNGLPEDAQASLTEHFTKLEEDLWALARETNELALSCTTGGDCDSDIYQAFDLELVEVSEADMAQLQDISSEVIVGEWIQRCERTYADCGTVWYETVGAARGFTAP